MAKRIFVLATLAATAAASEHGHGNHAHSYDPDHPTEPFDDVAKMVTTMFSDETEVDRREDGWRGSFCSCMENGHISSWYQYASAMYLIDTCNPSAGLVLRTGHLQDRHVEPLQGMMACDTLKLVSYCLSHHAPDTIPSSWKDTCSNAHYTVPACDVDCNGAVHHSGVPGFAALMAAAFAAFLGLSS